MSVWTRMVGAAALTLLAACSQVQGASWETSSTTPHTASCAKPAPRSSQDWTRAFEGLGGQVGVADQGTTFSLPDGRVVWVLNDTMMGTLNQYKLTDWTMPHSSLVIADRGCLSVLTGPNRTSFLPDEKNTFFWPSNGYAVGDTVYLFAQQVRAVGPSATDFEVLGVRLARLSYTDAGSLTFDRWVKTVSVGNTNTAVQYGAGVETRGSYAYVYGTRGSDQAMVFGKALYLARLDKQRPQDDWSYWAGTGWSSNPTDAVPIRSAVGGVSNSVSADYVRGRWVLVTKRDEYLGDSIVMLDSARPQGPFRETVIARTDTEADLKNGDLTYSAFAHPELKLRSGKLLVTVCRNNLDFRNTSADVRRGRFYFLEVEFPA